MKKTSNKANKISKLAIFSGSLLVAVSAVMFLAPVIRTNAAEKSVDVTVNVNPIVSLSLDKSALNFNITPTSAGVFDSGSIVATVDTNSTGGYELYFSSEDSGTALTSLVSESTIASDFNSAVTSSSMSANKWGYSLDATNFNKIPALADQAKIKDLNRVPASSEKDTTVTIGTKIDSTLPSGTYSKKVVFSAIAHPSAVPTLHEITTMQQMTPEVCAATTTPAKTATALDWDGSYHGDETRVPRKSLQDTRDGKYYLVSKLADGNCCMSQNLELMLDSTKSLSNLTTDLNTKTSWTPENSTLTVAPTSSTWPAVANAAAYSYYPISTDRYYRGGTTKSSSPTASGAEYDWEKAGTYYNWYAATAGSGTYATTSGNVGDSICPKGWMLPLGTTENKSFYYLLTTKYTASAANMINSPLNFVRAGDYYYPDSTMENQGSFGNIWASTAYSQKDAYNLNYYASSTTPRFSSNKSAGFNIRCVARQGNMKSIKTRANKTTNLAIFSGSLLVASFAAIFFAPVIRTNAAEEFVDVIINVNPIISLSLDKSVLNFNITPTSAGVFDSDSIIATVDTNSTGGYELYFSSEDSGTALTSLVSESTIASDFSSTVTSSTMSNNKWGYSLDATNFSKVPALADQAIIKSLLRLPTSAEKNTTVTIGTKIDSTLPSGAYSKKIVFSAIAHPSLIPTIHSITTMQQMTPEICTNTTTPTTSATALDWDGSYHDDTSRVPRTSLQDTRDGKYYLVSKLADGNCWMSQNLELMFDSTEPLTNEETDLNSKTSWLPENSTLTTTPTTSTWPRNSETAASSAYSYYPIATERYFQGGTSISSAPTAFETEYDWEKAGIYYNWYSATAGSGTYATIESAASDSICPKGWRLPIGPEGNKSWYYLITTIYKIKDTDAALLNASPFNTVRAGLYFYGGSMGAQGTQMYLWSGIGYRNYDAWVFYSTLSGSSMAVSPHGTDYKASGFNVRCVARQGIV